MHRVWSALEAKNAPEPRRAWFACTLCLAWPDGEDLLFTGTARGRLVWPPRGSFGFGFDPMFVPEGESLTFGEMEPERKHAISHRARAFDAFLRDGLDR
jgi:XTP/dITP diphosphohydrolase